MSNCMFHSIHTLVLFVYDKNRWNVLISNDALGKE